ncbi:ABC transporter permease [Candidatus Nitrosoglobus terrae]|uniref:ABC transporter permease n=1 Tax=Candidatus Nitrosoglobus terrae TaxID=1630141 RepID=A0A1Q2SN69_9GAMM|nr:iron export ABC transporter permease subunit FetB [Candidatus Nitrosoglobus terrae]BAW80562.1 ABC transporter permease [Candidatus Nitrosoglobus terrae]
MNYISLNTFDLAMAAMLVVLNGALSFSLGLKLERQLLIAAIRMMVQLTLVGLVLKILFTLNSPQWTGFAALAMILFAGGEVVARQKRRIAGFWFYGLGTGCMLLATGLITVLALTIQIRPDPWYAPRYTLPLLGMILGNTMTGISLGLDNLFAGLVREQRAIEAQLALGATRWKAVLPVTRNALYSALIPIINAMAASGLVSLPGMMTGQILAGVDPIEAVKYQMLIMFLISGSTAFGSVGAVLGGVYWLTDTRHRLRLDRLIWSKNI